MSSREHPVTAQELREMPLAPPVWIVEGMLSTGLHILAGAPKIGKSLLAVNVALAVGTGAPIWDRKTHKCGVLLLTLEETDDRNQKRLFSMADEASHCIKFWTEARTLQTGLMRDLEDEVSENPDTKLIVIDTFQKIRNPIRDNAYAADYDDMSILKRFADEHRIAIIAVHHTRKMPDSDVFATVSGTTGLTGCADSIAVLAMSSRFSKEATFSITGRDVEEQELKLKRNGAVWELVERTSQAEIKEREIPPSVLKILDYMEALGADWEGTASGLAVQAGVDVKPAILSKYLNQHRFYLEERGFEYRRDRNRESRTMSLMRIPRDGCDGNDA